MERKVGTRTPGRPSRDLNAQKPDIATAMQFFRIRKQVNGREIYEMLGPMERKADSWFRFLYIGASSSDDDYESRLREAQEELVKMKKIKNNHDSSQLRWQTAWHGTSWDCIYSILYFGKITGNEYVEWCENYTNGRVGVYTAKHVGHENKASEG